MLVILSTHPIQYQVPIWQALSKKENAVEVWYLTDHGTKPSFDSQFGKSFSWDIDTLQGYPYRFIAVNKNASPNQGFFKLRLTKSLHSLFREKKVTSILINGWQVLAYWQVVWQAHRAGVEIWLRAETNDLRPITWKESFRKFLLNQFFKRIKYFLYIGKANKRFYLKYGIQEHQLKSAPYSVDNDRFSAEAVKWNEERSNIRRQWNIPEGAVCFAFIGKFIPKKRPMDLIEAAKAWKGKPIHLLFVGSGELEADLKSGSRLVYDEGENIGVNNSNLTGTSFTGFLNQSEMVKAYIAADALVLPSNFGETWGLVVNEAMACGTPCLVSDQVGCAEDLVEPVHPNLVFKCGNIESLVKAMDYFCNHPVSKHDVTRIIEKYHMHITVDSIRELYHKTY